MRHHRINPLVGSAALAGLIFATLAPAPAKAWFRGGVFIGVPPIVVGPPVVPYPAPYYYPPAYYGPGPYAVAPPAAGYAPAPQSSDQPPAQSPAPQLSQADTPYGSTCYAGFYVCRAPAQTHVGTGCSCPGLGAPSYGVVQ